MHIFPPTPTAVVITVGPTSSKPLNMISGIEYPTHIATGQKGEVVVASYMSHQVHVYGQDYQLVRTFGSNGFLDGQFMCPSGIAIDGHNRVFVSSLNKVDVFTMEGQFVTAAGTQGKGPLEFTNAAGIAMSKAGKVYVADAQNNRIQVLNSDLTYSTSFSEACKTVGSGRLSQPQAIAINSVGNVYVADMMNHAVQAFTPNGTFLLKFGKYGPATTPGAVCTPTAIAIDREDNVYVGCATGTIGIFSKEGNFLQQFGSYGSELGQFNIIKGLHIDRKGQLYVSEWTSNRIQIFPGSPSMVEDEKESALTEESKVEMLGSSKPAYLIGPTSTAPIKVISEVKAPGGITEGKNGEIVVSSSREHKVFVYSPENDYQLSKEIGGQGSVDGKFTYPSGVALTADNLIVVCSHRKLQWFTMEGDLVHAVGYRYASGNKQDLFDNPIDITISKDGQIYVIDSGKNCVTILNSDATFHHSFEFSYLDVENDRPPNGLAVNSESNLYFADSSKNCVRVFSSCGKSLFKFGKSGSWMERGVLLSPMAIAIDSEDNVFVGSVLMISIFDKSGSFLRSVGGQGSDPGQFNFIKGLHIGKNGFIYVSEYSNNRVQVFEGSKPSQSSRENHTDVKTLRFRRPVHTIGPNSEKPVKIISDVMEPFGVTTTENGNIVVAAKAKKLIILNSDYEHHGEISRLIGDFSRNNEIVDLVDIALCKDGCFLVTIKHQLLKITPLGEVVAAVGSRGKRGNGDLQLDLPNGIAVRKSGQVFVVDSGNHRIQVFNADLSFKSTLCLSNDSLERPAMEKIALNSEGSIYVTDKNNNCVYVFDQEEKFLFSFENLSSPVAIAIDHEDYIYLATSQNEILIFSSDGCFIRVCGKRGNEPGEFHNIKAMHIDHKGSLYVCENTRNRIQIFTTMKPTDQEAVHSSQKECQLDSPLPEMISDNIQEPHGIAEGRNGEIVVASSSDHKVLVYDCQHTLMAQFGSKGDLDGQLNYPTGIAVTSDNYILVSCRDRLQWFTMKGELVHAVGNKGKEELEFDYPVCIALGKDGKIYVLEKCNKRVQILKGNAKYLSSFKISKDHFPEALAVNSEGKVFLVDTRNSCIQVFSSEGNYLSNFCVRDCKEPSLPTAIAIDCEDRIYIGNASGVIYMFDKDGNFMRAFQGNSASGHYSVIRGLYVGQRGHIYVSNFSNNEVQVFRQLDSFNLQVSLESAPSLPVLPYRPVYTVGPKNLLPIKVLDGIQKPNGITTDNQGRIFVSSNQENKILIYNPGDCKASSQITEISNPRDPRSKGIIKPSGLAYTSDGHLLTSCQNQLIKMNLNGMAVAFLGSARNQKGTKEDELNDPGGIALGDSNQIFLVDRGNHRIQTFHSNFAYITSFFNPDSKACSNEYLERIALNSTGNLYITDRRNCNVQVYDNSGKFKFKFGKEANKRCYNRGGLSHPHAIAIDKEDFVYVGDESGVVSIFDRMGSFVRSFGGPGDKPGQFGNIQAMHFDYEGHLYICEWNTNRVQVFQGQ